MNHSSLLRRHWLAYAGACALGAWTLDARAGFSGTGPLKVGVESALMISGLAQDLKRGIGADLGLALTLMPGPSLTLLDQLESGEIDVAITQAPDREAGLEKQGLAFNAKTLGAGRYVLIGGSNDAAAIKGRGDIVQALSEIARIGVAGGCTFVTTTEPSGTREMEKTLWKAVGPRPLGAWMRAAASQALGALQMVKDLSAQQQAAYCIIEHGVWQTQGNKSLLVYVDGDARLDAPYRVATSYRTHHPAAKFVCGWLGGASGHRLVNAFGHGYRA